MSQRGVLFATWEADADAPVRELLARAVASLREIHPELPHHVAAQPGGAPWLDKPRLLAQSPFATTLFLDSDAVVLGRLDFGFEMAERYGLACCLADNPWQRRHLGVQGDACEYDAGVLFFDAKAKPTFEVWARLAPHMGAPVSSVVDGQVVHMPGDERLGFAQAVEQSGVAPFVLPLNWNLKPRRQRSFFGPIKLWRGDGAVPALLPALNGYYERPDAIMQFHELEP
ncbi:MAG: hypothetical protein WDO24_19980 [Pseudomonadota bacterium]